MIYTIFPGLFLKYYPALREFYSRGKITYTCLPLQSGSKRVLKLMNRDYDLEKIVNAVAQIKGDGSPTRLFTHFIMNFPSETAEEFQKSLELAPFFDYTLLLPYGENHRTQASEIVKRCTPEQMAVKVKMAEKAIEKDDFKGMVVV